MAKKSKAPPKSKMARTQVVGATAARMAGKKIASETKGLFLKGEAKKELRQKTREELASMIFDGLVRLRGTALKLGQLLVSETGILPEEYSRELEKAQYRVPPLSSALVRSLLRRELPKDFDKIFSDFDWNNARAASLGQVHRGKLRSGETVAVKIQYPGIQDTMVSDFELVRKVIAPLTYNGLLTTTLEEIQERLEQEVDYLREAENLQWFASRAPAEGLLVPKVYPEFSSPRVLVMGYVEGLHLDEWIARHPEQAHRDEMARKLFRFFRKSVFEWRRLHSDPHFGNFLVNDHGAVHLIDYGSVKVVAPGDTALYELLWAREPDAETLIREYEARGAEVKSGGAQNNREFLDAAVFPYMKWIQELIGGEEFDFRASSDFVKRGYEVFSGPMFNPQMQEFSDELAFVHRTLLGYMVLFQRLGAVLKF